MNAMARWQSPSERTMVVRGAGQLGQPTSPCCPVCGLRPSATIDEPISQRLTMPPWPADALPPGVGDVVFCACCGKSGVVQFTGHLLFMPHEHLDERAQSFVETIRRAVRLATVERGLLGHRDAANPDRAELLQSLGDALELPPEVVARFDAHLESLDAGQLDAFASRIGSALAKGTPPAMENPPPFTNPTPLRDDHLAEIARRRFEEPRKGEMLVRLDPVELDSKSKRLAVAVNEWHRVDAAAKDFSKAASEKKKRLDEEIEQLSLEVEYGRHWIPSQQGFDDIFARAGSARSSANGHAAAAAAAGPPDEGEGEEAAPAAVEAPAKGRRGGRGRRKAG